MKTSCDTELTVRLSKDGQDLYFYPKAKAMHIFHISFCGTLKKAFFFGANNVAIRRMHGISGSNVIGKRGVAVFLVPFFGAVKLTRISWRNIRYNGPLDKLLYVATLPLMLFLIFSWMLGFYRGLLLEPGETA